MKRTCILLLSSIVLSGMINAAISYPIKEFALPDGPPGDNNHTIKHIGYTGSSLKPEPVWGSVFNQVSSSGWHALGAGLNDDVRTIVKLGNDIYVGGLFTNAGGNEFADYIARWDGSNWHPLGTGLNHWVSSIAIHNGELYVGGNFRDAGGNLNADYIARWDGSSWNALQGGLNYLVQEITVDGDDIYIGGQFSDAGGIVEADKIVRWTDNGWHAMGESIGIVSTSIEEIIVHQGDVYIGGTFENGWNNPDINRIAYWDGSVWKPLGTGLNDRVYAMASDGITLYVGGKFTDAGGNPEADYAVTYAGSGWWEPIGNDLQDIVISLGLINSDIFLGGGFADLGGVGGASGIASWDGSSWHALGTGLLWGGFPYTIVHINEKVYVGGFFSDAGGNLNADMIAYWDPSSSVPTHSSKDPIFIYPNPTTGIFNVRSDYHIEGLIKIMDNKGRLIQEKSLSSAIEIDISKEADGIYLVKIDFDNQSMVRKIVKR